jgi:hypothetical protein
MGFLVYKNSLSLFQKTKLKEECKVRNKLKVKEVEKRSLKKDNKKYFPKI